MPDIFIGDLPAASSANATDEIVANQGGTARTVTPAQIVAAGRDAYLRYEDQKTSGTGGGSFTTGDWRVRTLTNEVVDTGGHGSLSSNQITLAAGTYRARIRCPAYNVNRHQARLYNVTGSAVLLTGTSEYSGQVSNGMTTYSEISGRFTLSGSTVVQIEHQCQTTQNTQGFGVEAGFGTEIYTIAEFWRES